MLIQTWATRSPPISYMLSQMPTLLEALLSVSQITKAREKRVFVLSDIKLLHSSVFFRTAPGCTTVWTCTPWRALWLTSCELSRIQWKVRLPFPFYLRRCGGGRGIVFGVEEACRTSWCRDVTGPFLSELSCFFRTPAYFLPRWELNTTPATSCTFTWPLSSDPAAT